MAAEFTANVVHALEMEHMAGLDRSRGASDSSAADGGATGFAEGGGADGALEVEDWGISARRRGESRAGGVGFGAGPTEMRQGLPLPPETPLTSSGPNCVILEAGTPVRPDTQFQQEHIDSPISRGSRNVSGRISSDTEGRIGGHDTADTNGGRRETDVFNDSHRRTSGGGGLDANTNGRGGRAFLEVGSESSCVVTTPITQADLNRNTGLRITGRSDGVPARSPENSRAGGDCGVAARRSATEASRSAPSSPTGRRESFRESTAPSESGLEGQGSRARAHSMTGGDDTGVNLQHYLLPGLDAESHADSAPAANVCRTVGPSSSMVDETGSDYASVRSSARPPAEYARDGRHFLPRFTGEALASVLRGQHVGLEQQLEAPNDETLEDSLSRPPRIPDGFAPHGGLVESMGGVRGGGDGSSVDNVGPEEGASETRDAVRATRAAIGWPRLFGMSSVFSGATAPDRANRADRSAGGFQIIFGIVVLLLALDGLRHRVGGLVYGGWGATLHVPPVATSPSSRPTNFGYSGGGGVRSGDGGGSGGIGFQYVYLPPTCLDTQTGATMAIWATPAGPCLSPGQTEKISRKGAAGEGEGEVRGSERMGCATSFRLCSSLEVGLEDSRPNFGSGTASDRFFSRASGGSGVGESPTQDTREL